MKKLKLHAYFYSAMVKRRGRKRRRSVSFVKIWSDKHKDAVIVRPMCDADKQRFKKEWRAFRELD